MKELSTPDKHDQKLGTYRSYLLRLWCTEQSESDCWRASLENPRTGERIGFANPEELFAFLIQLIEGESKSKIRSSLPASEQLS